VDSLSADESVSEPFPRGEPGFVPAHAGRRV
jgi:hypothetical protein